MAASDRPTATGGEHGPGSDISVTTDFIRPRAGHGNVLVPTGSRRAAMAGISLLTRSRPAALAAQWLLYGAVAAAGPRIIPGPRTPWSPPGEPDRWRELAARLDPFDEMAVYERPQASREGVAAVLLRSGRPVGFLKLRADKGELDREARALEAFPGAMEAFPGGASPAFRVPRLLDRDTTAGWHWMVIEAMPPRPARPAPRPDVDAVVDGVQSCLAPVLPRPEGTPAHWLPMHGDLTPWNLRKCGPGLPWLIDWEDASWAPPGADHVYLAATRTAVFGTGPDTTRPAEAIDFWLRRVACRCDSDDDSALKGRLTAALKAMRGC
ncbi:phosphotransferase [Actinomadura barringtoniae]|uniref:Phosphotransferase n=1 Tax=Actinomadura barringtoniae TaxID=1427535 RepID=A0A939P7F8_9ACTN|nr:phosphotransferase [Actinomadura barringtoniae]MBO2446990.1 phosphotransferase [Actinomadura barringtoniae]